ASCANRWRADAPPGRTRRAPRRGLADAANGSALSRRSERATPVPRSARVRLRPGACIARQCLRAGVARALAGIARRSGRPGLARRARGGHGRARRCPRRAAGEGLAEQGVAVAAGRRETVQRLDRACAEAEGPFPRAWLMLLGTVEGWLDAMPGRAAEAEFASALAVNRQSDAQTGGAIVGPHRSDLAVELAEKGIAAELASTGEQKALLISIVLAHSTLQRAIRGEPPLLLLDE